MTDGATSQTLPPGLSVILAVATGMIAANIYYAQPLAGPISESLGLSPQAAGLIVMLTQAGYGVGLFFIVSLGDMVENRTLTIALILIATIGLLGAALSIHALPFLISAGLIGLGSVAVQVLVPFAAHMAPDATRGRVIGQAFHLVYPSRRYQPLRIRAFLDYMTKRIPKLPGFHYLDLAT